MSWNVDQLKQSLLKNPQVRGWIITQEFLHRRERYFLRDQGASSPLPALAIDQDRDTRSQSVTARLLVSKPGSDRQGEIVKRFFPLKPLAPQISEAIEAARQTDMQAWDLPREVPPKIPALRSADPRVTEDLEKATELLTEQIRKSVSLSRDTRFDSSELFVSLIDRELHLSNGLVHRSSQTQLFVEAAYSYEASDSQGKKKSDEYVTRRWGVSLDDLDIPGVFDEASDRARNSLDVRPPETGKYAVLVDSEVLCPVMNDLASHITANHKYLDLPHKNVGDELIPGAEGDRISMSLDPTLDFGADTVAVSNQGVLQSKLDLVQGNRVVAVAADAQYAQYLGMEPNTVRGSVTLQPGMHSHAELTRAAPRVLEILQFSAIFTDPNTATFSSEIRLAKLYDNESGKVSYVKGGSLSGNSFENLRRARFSKETRKRVDFTNGFGSALQGVGYFGPEYILLNDVSIVG